MQGSDFSDIFSEMKPLD